MASSYFHPHAQGQIRNFINLHVGFSPSKSDTSKSKGQSLSHTWQSQTRHHLDTPKFPAYSNFTESQRSDCLPQPQSRPSIPESEKLRLLQSESGHNERLTSSSIIERETEINEACLIFECKCDLTHCALSCRLLAKLQNNLAVYFFKLDSIY